MGLFKDWKGTRYIIQLCIIKLVCCLGWLSAIVSGQMELSETVSSSATFPDSGITCLGNLAVFFSSFLRGRLHLEIGAKDVLATLTGPTKLKNIEEDGWEDINCFKLSTSSRLTYCSVLMLSREMPNSSMRQFLEYIANVHDVWSILLQYFPLQSLPLAVQICNCPPDLHRYFHLHNGTSFGCKVLCKMGIQCFACSSLELSYYSQWARILHWHWLRLCSLYKNAKANPEKGWKVHVLVCILPECYIGRCSNKVGV